MMSGCCRQRRRLDDSLKRLNAADVIIESEPYCRPLFDCRIEPDVESEAREHEQGQKRPGSNNGVEEKSVDTMAQSRKSLHLLHPLQ